MPDKMTSFEMGSNMSAAVGWIGMDEFKANIERLYGRIAGPVMREALYAGARVIQRAVIDATPVGKSEYTYLDRRTGKPYTVKSIRPPGQARANVVIYERQNKRALFKVIDAPNILIGYSKKEAFYMYWYEFGRSNQAAHPVVRPAFDSTSEAAFAEIKSYLESAINEAA